MFFFLLKKMHLTIE